MKNKKIVILLILTLVVTFGFSLANVGAITKVSCGNITGIPKKIPELTSYLITVMQVAVPVILVIMGSLDLFKGITSQKEDEIKKGQQTFIKRLIVAGLIFFVIVFVKLLVSVVADKNSKNIVDCVDCFISNDCTKWYELIGDTIKNTVDDVINDSVKSKEKKK